MVLLHTSDIPSRSRILLLHRPTVLPVISPEPLRLTFTERCIIYGGCVSVWRLSDKLEGTRIVWQKRSFHTNPAIFKSFCPSENACVLLRP